MNIKALIPFTIRDSVTGNLTSIACGAIATVTDDLGNSLIADGLAEVYSQIVPKGALSISANGTYDVSQYASATVSVGTLTVTYDANGGTGTIDAQTVIAGNSINLSDGTGLTAPEGKEFAGWGLEATATEAEVTSPYTPTENVTLYAVWVDVVSPESESESESESTSESESESESTSESESETEPDAQSETPTEP